MTTAATLSSFVVPVLGGFAFVRACIPGERHWCRHDWLRLCLGIGIGFGLCSCMFFLWLQTYGAADLSYIGVEVGAVLALVAIGAYRAGGCRLCKSSPPQETSLARWKRPLLIAFGLIFLVVCLSFALESRVHPEGQGDAWAIWNLKARFLFRAGDQWRTAFSNILVWSHPDYPLLLPALVASRWTYIGTDARSAPVGIAWLFTFATVGLLTTGLYALGAREKALLAGIVLLGTNSFIRLGGAQYADVPIGFFFLASVLLLCMADRLPSSATALAGISAGLAAWTKNEGVLFFLLVLIAMKWNKQAVGTFLKGASCVLAVLVTFKLRLAGPNYLAQSSGAVLLRDVTDPSRYLSIAAGYAYELTHFGGQRLNPLIPLAALLFLPGLRANPGIRSGVFVLSAMCAGVSLAYLISPFDLSWQIAWSLDRLLLQLWPSALLICFYRSEFPVALSATRSESASPAAAG